MNGEIDRKRQRQLEKSNGRKDGRTSFPAVETQRDRETDRNNEATVMNGKQNGRSERSRKESEEEERE